MIHIKKNIKRRRLGQHFIYNKEILDIIVKNADPSIDDIILEVGAGLRDLTSHIVGRCGKVIAVEKDEKLFNTLRQRFSKMDYVDLIHGDIFKIRIPYFNKMISNIPYSISRQFISWILKKKFTVAVLLLQNEFAQKLAAKPGSKEYSVISVVTQHVANVNLKDFIPRHYFHPPPQVDSRIAIIKPKKRGVYLNDDFEKFIVRLFSYKNKTVKNALTLLIKKYDAKINQYKSTETLIQIHNIYLNKKVRQLTIPEIEELFKTYYRKLQI